MKDDAVHRVPEGRVPLAFDVQPAEARGRRLHDDVLPLLSAERAKAAYPTPWAIRALGALQPCACGPEGVDHAEDRQAQQRPLLAEVEDEPLVVPAPRRARYRGSV
jgi:hypothetical protein